MDAMEEIAGGDLDIKIPFQTSSNIESSHGELGRLPVEACGRGRVDVLRQHLTMEADINQGFHMMTLDEKQCNAMEEDESETEVNPFKEELNRLSFEAAERGDVGALQRLTWMGADLNQVNDCGETLFNVTAKSGRLEMLRFLHSQGCNLNEDTLYQAVRGDNVDCVRFLLECGIDPFKYNGVDILCRAAEEGNVSVLRELTSKSKAFVNARDVFEITPLLYAAQDSHEEAVDYLISLGAEINAGTLTNLLDENEDMFKYLIDKGGDVNVVLLYENVRQTPLIHSTIRNNLDMVEFLLDRGANIEAINEKGWTSLHIAAFRNFIPLVKILIARGALINSKDKDGLTPLDVAQQKTRQVLLGNDARSGKDI